MTDAAEVLETSGETEMAEAMRRYFNACRVAGFDQDQSFTLTKDYHLETVKVGVADARGGMDSGG